MNITKNITKSSLQIQSVRQLIKLSKGQDALLQLIRKTVQENKSLDWDALVKCFYENVSKNIYHWTWANMKDNKDFSRTYAQLDLLEEYKNNSTNWNYYGRSRVRQWFVSTIGILVVKGQLFVIPTIELE